MRRIEIKDWLAIDADLATVWEAIEKPALHAEWHPFLTAIDGEHSLGAERSCSVSIGGKPSRTRERCVVAEPEQRMIWRIEEDTSGFSRMVSDWTAGFSLTRSGEHALVTAESAFRPRNPFVLAMMPLVRRKFHQTQQAILDGLGAFSAGPVDGGDSQTRPT